MQLSDMVVVGEVTSTHGVRGDVKIRSFTDNPKQLKKYDFLYNEHKEIIKVTFKRDLEKGMFIGSFDAITNKEDAALLKGTLFYIHKSQRPEIEDHECYLSDLINCKVIMENAEIGKITAFHDLKRRYTVPIRLDNVSMPALCLFNQPVYFFKQALRFKRLGDIAVGADYPSDYPVAIFLL